MTTSANAPRARALGAGGVSDAVWMPILLALWIANRKVYGARKLLRKAARRSSVTEIGRRPPSPENDARELQSMTRTFQPSGARC